MFSTVRRIILWCDAFKGRLYTGFVFSFFSYWAAAMPLVISAIALGRLIDSFKEGSEPPKGMIWISIVLILISILLRFLFDYFRARFQETISYELTARDRLAIGYALKRVSLGYFSNNSTGNILSSLTTGLMTLEGMGIRMIDTFVGGYLNFIAVLIGLAVIRPGAAVIAVATAAVSFISLMLISRHSSINAPVATEANKKLTEAALEYARGLSVIRSFGYSGAEADLMNDAIAKSEETHVRTEWGFIPGNCLHMIALKCGSVGIAAAACYCGLKGTLDITTVLMLVFFAFTIFNPLEPISDSAHVLGVIEDAMDKMDALKADNFIDENGKDIVLSSHDIEYDHVTFGYGDREIIKDVSFRIPENTSTAIVGPSGSGKTTLVNLMARFYDVQGGSISVGGHNIKEFTCESLLSNMSMVFQNVYLFHDSVRNNICFGKPDTTEEEMIKAAEKACCHDFIMDLPDGYDTVIGEGGSTLSGGEKQRISIARAILKDAPIVILDEATASIDPENEHLIQDALSELTKGKTVITIAHRLATIENADQILVVDDGRIVQRGRHEELLKEGGIYRNFTEARSRAEGWVIAKTPETKL